jgi:hypothetical protein
VGFVAIADAPGNCFIAELLELYPDAEVVCVRRNPVKWWKSWEPVTKRAGAGGRGLLELAPITSAGENVVSKARGSIFGAVSYINMCPMSFY